MNGKKGQIFAISIVITFLIAGCYIIALAIKGNIDFSLNLKSPIKMINMYQDADKFMIFAGDSGKMAIMQAYYEIAKENRFAENCRIYDGYIEISDECGLSDEIDRDFAIRVNDSLQKYLQIYKDKQFNRTNYSVGIINDAVNFSSDNINLHTQVEEGFFPFGAVYKFNPSFSINITEMGLYDMKRAVETIRNCFLNRKNADIVDCTKQLKNFDVTFTIKEDKTFFDLNTKKSFFYNKEDTAVYDKITVRFFVQE